MNPENMSKHLPDNPRILLVAPSLRHFGGQAVQANQLLVNMRAEGRRVDLLATDPRPSGIFRLVMRIKYIRSLLVSILYVISLFQRVPYYDVVHVFSGSASAFMLIPAPAILIARFYGKPTILNYRSGYAEEHFSAWSKIIFPIMYLLDAIVVPSEYLTEIFAEYGFAATAIANVVAEKSISYRLRDSVQPKIIIARAHSSQHNVACALHAYKMVKEKYPRAELTLLGCGSEERKLREMVASWRLAEVNFAGQVQHEDVDRYYQDSDVMLNSSASDDVPTSILEAFAAGLPVVTTDAGGIASIITDDVNGRLVASDDHVALAERIFGLIENASEVRRLSEQGAIEIEKYRWTAVSAQWRELYRHTIAAHTAPAVTLNSEHSQA